MLKNNASFFNRDIVGSEREYAERLQVAMEESGTFHTEIRYLEVNLKVRQWIILYVEYTHKSKSLLMLLMKRLKRNWLMI